MLLASAQWVGILSEGEFLLNDESKQKRLPMLKKVRIYSRVFT